jgi:hypothetical protein
MIRLVYDCDIFLVIMLATATDYLLALATLGDATNNRNDPISVVPHKVAKTSSHMTVTCHQWKHCFMVDGF